MAFCWLMIFIVLLLIEICTVNLVSIWFACGALLSFLTAMFTNNIFIQLGVFIVVSIFTLLITKPIIKKVKGEKVATNLDRVIGMTAVVTEDIKRNEVGEVKVAGKRWSAISKKSIKKGEEVIVDKIEGVKLIVSKKEEK